MRWRLPILGLLLLLAMAPVASADPPRAGKRYDGSSGNTSGGFVAVSRDGSRLSSYFLGARTRCTDGRTRYQGIGSAGEEPALISPSGAVSFSGKPGPLVQSGRGGRRVRGTATATVRGAFEEGGRVFRGTIETGFDSSSFDCSSGPVPFKVSQNGTPGALYRGRRIATGKYSARGRRLKVGLRVFAPAPFVRRMLITYRQSCRRGASLRSGYVFPFLDISRRGRFAVATRVRGNIGSGLRSVDRVRVSGRFSRRGRAYIVRGRFTARVAILRGGRRIDTCVIRNRRFSGRFTSGPANLPG